MCELWVGCEIPMDSNPNKDLTPSGALVRMSIRGLLDHINSLGFDFNSLISRKEVLSILEESLLWAASLFGTELPLSPTENPEVIAGETITDPRDKVRQGTVDSRRFFVHPRRMEPPSIKWFKALQALAQWIIRAKQDPAKDPDGPGLMTLLFPGREDPAPTRRVNQLSFTIRQLAKQLRKQRKDNRRK